MRIIFAIPTWNRAQQLTETVERIQSIAGESKSGICVVISDNASMDATDSTIKKLKIKFGNITSQRHQNNIGAEANYESVLNLAVNIADTEDYIWLFGDDDDLEKAAIDIIASIVKVKKPIFVSAGNSKLPKHTFGIFEDSVQNLCCRFGYYMLLSWLSQCIFSVRLVKEILQHRSISNSAIDDCLPHSSSIFTHCYGHKIVYADYPLATWRDYPGQYQEVQERWHQTGTYLRLTNSIKTIEGFQAQGWLPEKLNRRFFRNWKTHIWDILLLEFTKADMKNPGSVSAEQWNTLFKIPSLLSDPELAKRLSINFDLHRGAVYGDQKCLQRAVKKYQQMFVYGGIAEE